MNTTHSQNERSIQLSIIISLILHISLIFYLSTNNFEHQQRNAIDNKETAPTKELSTKKETEWVETKTRSSINTQAAVFFRDDYHDDYNDTKEEQDKNEEHENENTESVEQQESPAQDQTPIKKEKEAQSTIVPTPKPQKTSSTSKHSPQKQNRSTMAPSPTQTPEKQATAGQKQLPSLAQLTQGMLNYMQESGKHSVSMLGKKHGTPTDEQLKYERYLERLNQCLHSSFVINSHKQPHCPLPDDSVTVYLALNKEGTIRNLKLVKSCGNNQVDIFVMHVLQDASSSFPPVPHYLPHDPFAIHYVIGTKPSYR